jgi:hypothetical protein
MIEEQRIDARLSNYENVSTYLGTQKSDYQQEKADGVEFGPWEDCFKVLLTANPETSGTAPRNITWADYKNNFFLRCLILLLNFRYGNDAATITASSMATRMTTICENHDNTFEHLARLHRMLGTLDVGIDMKGLLPVLQTAGWLMPLPIRSLSLQLRRKRGWQSSGSHGRL